MSKPVTERIPYYILNDLISKKVNDRPFSKVSNQKTLNSQLMSGGGLYFMKMNKSLNKINSTQLI
ncbi:hypothetical protein [Halalkalibacter alkalisediminis]|uniref:Uncharacterized protein n=1 Tax=Halalkalibacter alkalisediminis TaxID=935616 RepID=A0ABV6NKV2_9BACI|nr:hypothetical protein [Halalkalibacter alkalisediminis]